MEAQLQELARQEMAEAIRCKEQGNKAFRAGRHSEAVEHYMRALGSTNPDADNITREFCVVLHSNISECGLRSFQWAFSLENAEAALELDPQVPLCCCRCSSSFVSCATRLCSC